MKNKKIENMIDGLKSTHIETYVVGDLSTCDCVKVEIPDDLSEIKTAIKEYISELESQCENIVYNVNEKN